MGKQLVNFITCGCESRAPFLFDLCTKLHIYISNTGVDLEVENFITKTELPFLFPARMIVYMFFIQFLSSASLLHMQENATLAELTESIRYDVINRYERVFNFNAVLYNNPVNRYLGCCMALYHSSDATFSKCRDITEILLKVALSIISITLTFIYLQILRNN